MMKIKYNNAVYTVDDQHAAFPKTEKVWILPLLTMDNEPAEMVVDWSDYPYDVAPADADRYPWADAAKYAVDVYVLQ